MQSSRWSRHRTARLTQLGPLFGRARVVLSFPLGASKRDPLPCYNRSSTVSVAWHAIGRRPSTPAHVQPRDRGLSNAPPTADSGRATSARREIPCGCFPPFSGARTRTGAAVPLAPPPTRNAEGLAGLTVTPAPAPTDDAI